MIEYRVQLDKTPDGRIVQAMLPQKIVANWSEALLQILRKIFKRWKFRHSIDPDHYRRKIEKLQKAFLKRVRRPP